MDRSQIDHRQAIVAIILDTGEEIKQISSNAEKQLRRTGSTPLQGIFEAGNEALAAYVRGETEHALSRFNDHITQVEVHLSDENSDKKKGKDGQRCVMEARLEGRQPIVATHQATTQEQAVNGAADKLSRLIESTTGRINDQRRRKVDSTSTELDEPEE